MTKCAGISDQVCMFAFQPENNERIVTQIATNMELSVLFRHCPRIWGGLFQDRERSKPSRLSDAAPPDSLSRI